MFAIMDNKGIIEDNFNSVDEAINKITEIRENNKIDGILDQYHQMRFYN